VEVLRLTGAFGSFLLRRSPCLKRAMRASEALALTVTGDVGMLAEENAQRLVSIFSEHAMSCLASFRQVAESRGSDAATVQKNCTRGLASVRHWSVDVLNEEVAAMEALYPETFSLHRFVTVAAISELASLEPVSGVVVPPLPETYHAFLKRLVASPDLSRLVAFLESPMAHRRVVFLDAFRNAYHDMARRSIDRRQGASRQLLAEKPQSEDLSLNEEPAPSSRSSHASLLQRTVASLVAPAGSCKDKEVLLLSSPAFFDVAGDGVADAAPDGPPPAKE